MIRTPNIVCKIVCERIRVSVYVREDCLRVSERMCECVKRVHVRVSECLCERICESEYLWEYT